MVYSTISAHSVVCLRYYSLSHVTIAQWYGLANMLGSRCVLSSCSLEVPMSFIFQVFLPISVKWDLVVLWLFLWIKFDFRRLANVISNFYANKCTCKFGKSNVSKCDFLMSQINRKHIFLLGLKIINVDMFEARAWIQISFDQTLRYVHRNK